MDNVDHFADLLLPQQAVDDVERRLVVERQDGSQENPARRRLEALPHRRAQLVDLFEAAGYPCMKVENRLLRVQCVTNLVG